MEIISMATPKKEECKEDSQNNNNCERQCHYHHDDSDSDDNSCSDNHANRSSDTEDSDECEHEHDYEECDSSGHCGECCELSYCTTKNEWARQGQYECDKGMYFPCTICEPQFNCEPQYIDKSRLV